MTTTMPIKIKADSRRQTLWTAHRNWMDRCWDSDGHYVNEKSPNPGGYRAMLWHCMAYLDGDAHHIERANRIIQTNFTDKPCHFTPNATIDLLIWHRQKLDETTLSLLKNNLRMNLSYACTEDLKIHGYNDNHPYKAMHALVLGGEILNDKRMVQIGLAKLKQAVAFFAHAGFPCEYNSPTYSFVSLGPLGLLLRRALLLYLLYVRALEFGFNLVEFSSVSVSVDLAFISFRFVSFIRISLF